MSRQTAECGNESMPVKEDQPDRGDVLDVLKRARGYIAAGWTQGSYVEKRDGNPEVTLYEVFEGTVPEAEACFCAAGALRLATARKLGSLDADGFDAVYRACTWALDLTDACDSLSCITTNDRPNATQADVLRMFDQAIDAVEREVACAA